MITKEMFFICERFFTAEYCCEYLVALISIMLLMLVKGLIFWMRSMLKVFSVSMKMIFPELFAVSWKHKVVFPVEGEP